MKKLLCALLVALSALLVAPAAAPAGAMTTAQLTNAVVALQGKVKTLQTRVKTLQAQRLLRGSGAPAATLGRSGSLYLDRASLALYGPKAADGWGSPLTLKGATGETGATGPQGPKGDTGPKGAAGPDPAADPAYAGLFAIAPYVSLSAGAMDGVAGPNIVFQGANVHVRSATGEDDASGLGNLIVGWNPPPFADPPEPFRTGSNNLVVGSGNNFTSHGGFVVGYVNTASGPYAGVSGGYGNTASGAYASVSGGYASIASNTGASVSGGYDNEASGQYASVSGGYDNSASGETASASGGYGNTASGYFAGVGGGYDNTASGNYSSVSGGSSLVTAAALGWAGGAYHAP